MTKRFDRMTKQEQRVTIARDAFAWVKAGALLPQPGDYIEPTGVTITDNRWVPLCKARLGTCRVCSLGALFLAKASRCSSVTISDYLSDHMSVLEEHFDVAQLADIEASFEAEYLGIYGDEGSEPAVRFGTAYEDDTDRLCAILQNIIDNGGMFRPEVRP
jgi:hypothetical protein